MKTVYLVRHATAVGKKKSLPDFERSLTDKGAKEARQIARRFAKQKIKPALLISSPANRALETAHIFAKVWKYPIQKIMLKEPMYDMADPSAFLTIIRDVAGDHDSVCLFGHDPAFTDLAQLLGENFHESLPKGGAVGFRFDVDAWQDVEPAHGRLVLLEFPASKKGGASVDKDARKVLADRVAQVVRESLASDDPKAVKKIEKDIAKAGDAVARKFIGTTKNREIVLGLWQHGREEQRRRKAERADARAKAKADKERKKTEKKQPADAEETTREAAHSTD